MSDTIDRLTDPNHRTITTIFTTPLRVNENTYDAGTVRVALETSHNKYAKRIETRINREVVTDTGFITRSFMLLAGPNADAGLTLAKEPAPRFNARKAREQHDFLLTNLDLIMAHHAGDREVVQTLTDLLALASVAA